MDQEKFGKFICELRKERKMTQKQLGEQLHISDKAISKWERGQSIPDIEMISKIADFFEINTLELIQGQKIEEEKVDKIKMEHAIRETVDVAVAQKKKIKKRWMIYCVLLLCWMFFLPDILTFGYNTYVACYAKLQPDSPYHTCQFEIIAESTEGEGYYIYREQTDEHMWSYHIMGVTKDEVKNIFTLREKGMDLDRAPKLIQGDEYMYILFEGLDNEDFEERCHGNFVSADVQGFLPFLYRYHYASGEVERVELDDEQRELLIDVFWYQGKDMYITQQYENLIGELELGLYTPTQAFCNTGKGLQMEAIIGEGGLKTTGMLLENGAYVIASQQGIMMIDAKKNTTSKIKVLGVQGDIPFSRSYRSEMFLCKQNQDERYVLVLGVAEQCGEYGEILTKKTQIYVFNREWECLNKIEIPTAVSAVEHGKESVMITGIEENQVASYCVDIWTGKCDGGMVWEMDETEIERRQFDTLEESAVQWVYVPKDEMYVLIDNERYVQSIME